MKKLIMAGMLLAFLSVTTLPLAAAPDEPQTTTQTPKKAKKHSKKSKGAKQTPADSTMPQK